MILIDVRTRGACETQPAWKGSHLQHSTIFWVNTLVCFVHLLVLIHQEIQPTNIVANLSGIEIKDLKLKKNALASLQLPVEVKDGVIERVSLRLPPLTELTTKPTLLTIESLLLLACPQFRLTVGYLSSAHLMSKGYTRRIRDPNPSLQNETFGNCRIDSKKIYLRGLLLLLLYLS